MSYEAHVVRCSVKFLNPKGKLLGSGFWVHPDGYGVTCYHVINGGVGRPPGSLKIEFDKRELSVRYEPTLSKPEHDVAVFRLLESEITPVPFVRLEQAESLDRYVRAWGYRQEFAGGYMLSGRIQPGQDLGRGEVYNLSSTMPSGSSVAGMSGGAVLDPESGAVVGVFYAEEKAGPSVAYVHPIEKIFAAWPELPVKNDEAYKRTPWQEPLSTALTEHLGYQWWLFEEAPVLGKSPFALRDIYVDTECGHLRWGEVHDAGYHIAGRQPAADEKRPKNPFSELDGGRHDLLTTVRELIGDPRLSEPLIVQGIAGSGKSSFALKLCVELQTLGLVPILVRFKDLRLDVHDHIAEMLPQAVRLSDTTRSPRGVPPTPKDLFRGGEIFKERGPGAFTHICRYVLILDGWDEISVANEGFKRRVERMLEQIRNEYVDNPTLPLRLRLIITGRPTLEVYESRFLRTDTPILTIRPFKPDHLETFFERLIGAISDHPLTPPDEDVWPRLDSKKVTPFVRRYRDDFGRMQQHSEGYDIRDTDLGTSSLGVLGLPLLAQLTARLIAEWQHPPDQLIDNPTELYRNLVDLTCSKGGKAHNAATTDEMVNQSRIFGRELRELLWRTAEAITIYGKDVIPYETLRERLNMPEDTLDKKVSGAIGRHSLTSLLISFYFKGGFKHTGCEFAHKSFREYLFAEALVEVLKSYGDRAPSSLPSRGQYWQEFAVGDPRHGLSRRLAQMLAPQWPRDEIMFHVNRLIEWEIKRASGSGPVIESETSTVSIDVEGWKKIRDGLADLWDWWGEGTHLRSQPQPQAYPDSKPAPAYVADLIDYAYYCMRRSERSGPPRTATADSHLGYGLFQLCVWAHHFAAAYGLGPQPGARGEGGGRAYQSGPSGADGQIRFAPSGEKPEYFMNYIHRISGAGVRPNGWFPRNGDLRSVDLSGAHLRGIDFGAVDLTYAVLNGATVINAEFSSAALKGCEISNSNLDRVALSHTALSSVKLNSTNLAMTMFFNVEITDADLSEINLAQSVLREVAITDTNMAGANLAQVQLDKVIFSKVNLTKVNLVQAQLSECKFIDSDISGINWAQVNLNNVSFERVRYTEEDLPEPLRSLLK